MRFKGSNQDDLLASQTAWWTWRRETSSLPYLRQFADRLVADVESWVGPHKHVRDNIEAAVQRVDRSKLSDDQLREVVLLLCSVWHYGMGLRDWASRRGILHPDD